MIYDPQLWRKSYAPGIPHEIDVEGHSLIRFIEERLHPFADRPAMNFMGKRMKYREVMAEAERFAAGLSENGLGRGDVVALCMPNIPQYLFALLGALKAGCAVTGLSPMFSSEEMRFQLNDSGAKALVILDVVLAERLVKIKDQLPDCRFVFSANVGDYLPMGKRVLGKLFGKIPSAEIAPIPGKQVMPLVQFCQAYPAKGSPVEVDPEDACFIQYTGGTTGPPKGAVLTQRNAVAALGMAQAWMGTDFEPGRERSLAAFPFFHVAGLVANCLLTLTLAGEQTLIPDPRNLKHLIKEWDALKPTWGVMSPTLFTMLMNQEGFARLDFAPMKLCISGSAPFSPEGMTALEKVIGKGKVAEGFGMTESCSLGICNPVRGIKKVGAIGLPYPSVRVKIVDLVSGDAEMPVGEPGEIIIHGPNIMKGYHNKPKETANALRKHDGLIYMHTGDVGYMDADGYIFIIDRIKDMVIVGGFKVFSTEVEAKFYQHPAVMMCAIVGVPNPERPGSELVKLVVQKSAVYADRSDDEIKAELTAFARDNLAPYKVPKIIEIVEALPLTRVGKVDKKAIRAGSRSSVVKATGP